MAYTSPNIAPSGSVFSHLQAGGVTGILDRIIAAMAATGAPVTAPTVSAAGVSTAGGLLAAGGYFVEFTETNGLGETTIAPQSAVMTVATAGIPLITFPALQTGNTARNLYVTPANGASGTEVLYASGITAITTSLPTAVTTTSNVVAPPTTNSTGLTYTDSNGTVISKPMELLRAAKRGNLEAAYQYLAEIVRDFNAGDPQTFPGVMTKFKQAHAAFAAIAAACAETGVLMDANPGSIGPVTLPTGQIAKKRTWA